MRILGLDVGDRRIGVALSDALGLTAQPLALIERTGVKHDVAAICTLVTQHGVETIVVGHPLTMRGEAGVQADKVERFVQHLRPRVAVPVHLLDERLTTVQGQRALQEAGVPHRKQKGLIDQVAAQLILQHFLDAQRTS